MVEGGGGAGEGVQGDQVCRGEHNAVHNTTVWRPYISRANGKGGCQCLHGSSISWGIHPSLRGSPGAVQQRVGLRAPPQTIESTPL